MRSEFNLEPSAFQQRMPVICCTVLLTRRQIQKQLTIDFLPICFVLYSPCRNVAHTSKLKAERRSQCPSLEYESFFIIFRLLHRVTITLYESTAVGNIYVIAFIGCYTSYTLPADIMS